jgi:hypothetical protein
LKRKQKQPVIVGELLSLILLVGACSLLRSEEPAAEPGTSNTTLLMSRAEFAGLGWDTAFALNIL